MLNSVSSPAVRRRLSADDRRRQLVAIGLSKIVETPIQDLSLDDVAAEAGISRGLLFHYFPTKTDFYLACIAAAGRRMLRTTAPDERATGEEQVETVTRLMIALDVPEARRDVVRAWWAYTEDRALTWSAVPTGERPVPLSQLVEECVAALHALLRISS